MALRTYEFEGEQLTVAQIKERVPALSHRSITWHLESGRTTRQAMLTFDGGAARRAAGRNGRAAAESKGFFTTACATPKARAARR